MKELIKITTNEQGVQCVSARELHERLKIKRDFTDWIKKQLTNVDAIEDIDFKIIWYKNNLFNEIVKYNKNIKSMNRQGFYCDYTITIDIAKEICLNALSSNRLSKESKYYAMNVLNYLVAISNKGIKTQIKTRKELEFLDKLKTSLIPFNIKGINQYTVLNYRIDYYIPSLNIAIEYDENDHKNYSYKSQEVRQKEIEKELGCRFIRVSDKNSDEYNIGLVIKEMFNIKEGN